ncbi:TRAP transporter large permease [Marinihelvus fidelis]|uniref:TRAP transporter large permease protein n=1 Tax=Marinihelvus fidelis TaxID=2613842 RepID=A0A5N0TCV1_9GAMM|nr:TRAP transporter large permease [Marinihelvus fidelis]KAA9131676.1 TRAP transporter large permease [Marinihelvus fidelis]
MTLTVLLVTFAVLLLIGMPISFCLALSSLAAIFFLDLSPLVVLQRIFAGVNVFALIAIPFFIYSGEIMLHGGASERMVRFARALVGHWRGGLGQVNVLTSLLFGGISGSAIAGVSAVGGVLIPKMKEQGYDADYAVNVTVSASTLGLMIPPSHNMIIYAIAAGGGVSVGTLFLGGILPGFVTAALLMVAAYAVARKRGYATTAFEGWAMIGDSLLAATPGLLMILIIVGGIRLGIFTPTEASAIAVVYGLAIGFWVYRELGIKSFWKITSNATRTVASVLFLIAAASAFGWVLAVSDAPAAVAEFMSSVTDNKIVALLMINAALLILGAVMDMAPLIIIATPIFLPIAQHFGMDPHQFGVMLIMNLGVGLITPPVGTALFVGCAVGETKMEAIMRTIWPFYLAHLGAILLVTFVPGFTLWIPEMLS